MLIGIYLGSSSVMRVMKFINIVYLKRLAYTKKKNENPILFRLAGRLEEK